MNSAVMVSERKSARIVGIWFILATVAGILSAVSVGPIQSDSFPTDIVEKSGVVTLGSLLTVGMGVAVAGIAIAAYPVFRRRNETLALGYVVARIGEAVLFVVIAVSWLLMIVLGREYVAADGADPAVFVLLGNLLRSVGDWVGHVLLDVVIAPLHYLIFYSLLFRWRLVPRWLSLWGLIGVPLWLAAGILATTGADPTSSLPVVLNLPIAINEMVLAVWLIVKGFSLGNVDTPAVDQGEGAV